MDKRLVLFMRKKDALNLEFNRELYASATPRALPWNKEKQVKRAERSVEDLNAPHASLNRFIFGVGVARKYRRGLEPERVYVYYIVYYK